MQIKKQIASVLVAMMAFGTVGMTTTGCDLLKSKSADEDEDEDEDDDKEKPKEETPPPEDSAPDTGTGDVETYPDMVKIGGTVRLLRSFSVHKAADSSAEKLTGLARNTWVDLKFQRGNWLMVDWPSGPGELSPGWIQARLTDPTVKVAQKPTAEPTASATAEPSATASAEPSATATATATAEATATATATATAKPAVSLKRPTLKFKLPKK